MSLVRTALLLLLVACSNKLSGELTVDGTPFTLSSCRSGKVYNVVGVELVAEDGRKLRLGVRPDGQAEAFVLAAGAPTGDSLGPCGALTVSDQNSTVNGVRNVQGSATLDCSRVKGKLTFENCH